MSKDVKQISLEEAESFTSNQVTSVIKRCMNRITYGPNSLSIFHLKNLGPLATEHLTAFYNDSLKSCHLPSIWKPSLVIPIPNPNKDSSQGTSYRPISLLCPAAKVLEVLTLPSINKFLSPAKDQHGFRPRHSTTSALLQLTTDIETGFIHPTGFRSKNLATRAKSQHLFDKDVPVLTIKLTIDISSKVISNLVYANTRLKIKIVDSELPLIRSLKILGVYLDTYFSFNNHCIQMANSQQKKQRLEGVGRYQLGTAKGDY